LRAKDLRVLPRDLWMGRGIVMSGVAGIRHFGKVSVVPNLFYVATKFAHINFVPLIPLGSSVIVANSEEEYREGAMTKTAFIAREIPFSVKSFFMAYVRLILWLSFVASGAFFEFNVLELLTAAGVLSAGPYPFDVNLFGISAAAFVFFALALYWSYRGAVASERRAIELGGVLGYSEDTVRQHLAIRGYPFHRRGPKQFVWQCPHCNTFNRALSKPGRAACVRCETVKAINQPGYLVLPIVGAIALGTIVYFVWNEVKHPPAKRASATEQSVPAPAVWVPATSQPPHPPSPHGPGANQPPASLAPFLGTVPPEQPK